MKTVQLLGSTTLARVALPWFIENGGGLGARVIALDPGDEDEAQPWFAPVRGLCRELGVPIGLRTADLVLDLDPDRASEAPEQRLSARVCVRVLGPAGITPDLCRALLPGRSGIPGEWAMIFGDGAAVHARVPLAILKRDDGPTLLARATLRGIEAVAAGWGAVTPGEHLGTADVSTQSWPGLAPGRFRLSEAQLVWERPAPELWARIRALAGPWGGARCHLGNTAVSIESAELAEVDPATLRAHLPGTIIAVDTGLVVACGADAAGAGRAGSTGALRLLTMRPAWRPMRRAAEYATEVGAGPGYQLC